MNIMLLTLVICIFLGVIGTFVRIIVQQQSQGRWPFGEAWELGLISEIFIGMVAGGLAWLIYIMTQTPTEIICPTLYLTAIAFGFAGTDILENVLNQYKPDGG